MLDFSRLVTGNMVSQHNNEVYTRIGYSDERLAALRQRGVI